MDLKLDGLVINVTGGTSGIGLATVRELAAEGARPVAIARRAPEPGLLPEKASFIAADLSETAAAERIVAEVKDQYGRIDGLVNNAALFDTRDTFSAIDDEL